MGTPTQGGTGVGVGPLRLIWGHRPRECKTDGRARRPRPYILPVPELPDLEVYRERLDALLLGEPLERAPDVGAQLHVHSRRAHAAL